MRSRSARLFSSALAGVALVSAAYFLSQTDRAISERRTALRAFDRQAHDVATRIAEAHRGQQAYLAAGQSAEVWWPKVTALLPPATKAVAALHDLATDNEARRDLAAASTTLSELVRIDARAREYLSDGEMLMASDVVFTEGSDAAVSAVQQIESARLNEQRAFDASEADSRRLEAYATGGAVGFTLLLLIAMAAWPASTARGAASDGDPAPDAAQLSLRDVDRRDPVAEAPSAEASPDHALAALGATAELCSELGRVRDLAGLTRLLAQTARVLNARGLVVWLGSSSGADLRAVATHGYGDHVRALMRPVPRDADNAAAAAYRTGALQIVPAKPGTSLGAVVAPLAGADGCIGALAAEINDNGEVSEAVHAQASIIAAQLAGLLSPAQAEPSGAKAASA